MFFLSNFRICYYVLERIVYFGELVGAQFFIGFLKLIGLDKAHYESLNSKGVVSPLSDSAFPVKTPSINA